MNEDCPCKIKYSCKMNMNDVRDRVRTLISFLFLIHYHIEIINNCSAH